MGCLLLPIFAEVSRWAADESVTLGIVIYLIFAFAITLNPIAPGTAIDICGGFIFVILFRDGLGYGFFLAWFIGYVVIIVIHYISACLQYYMGRIGAVQVWMNNSGPIFILAASDAVLGDGVGAIKVGVVGYVFLDTLNGLNQGRINMDFWVQLLSEWSCIPAATAFTLLGASLAVQGEDGFEWTTVCVPMLILVAFLVSSLGSLYGAAELGNCTDTKAYWQSREKWQAVQYFNSVFGLQVTREGYEKDILGLASYGENTEDATRCLYAEIYPLQYNYIAKREVAPTSQLKAEAFTEFNEKVTQIRIRHYDKLRSNKDEYIKKGYMVESDSAASHEEDFWADSGYGPGENKKKFAFQMAIVISLIFSFWGGIYGFFWAIEPADAVQQGMDILTTIDSLYWFSLGWFGIVYNLYMYRYWRDQIIGVVDSIKFLFTCCKLEGDIETRFAPKKWEVPVELERKTLETLAANPDYGRDNVMKWFKFEIEHAANNWEGDTKRTVTDTRPTE